MRLCTHIKLSFLPFQNWSISLLSLIPTRLIAQWCHNLGGSLCGNYKVGPRKDTGLPVSLQSRECNRVPASAKLWKHITLLDKTPQPGVRILQTAMWFKVGRVSQGHRQCRHSVGRIRLPIHHLYNCHFIFLSYCFILYYCSSCMCLLYWFYRLRPFAADV